MMPSSESRRRRLLPPLRALPQSLVSATRAHWKSLAGLAGLLAIGAGAVSVLGVVGILDVPFILRRWNSLWGPAWVGVSLTTIAFLLGLVTALPLGLARAYLPGRFRRKDVAEFVPYRRAREIWGTGRAVRATVVRKARTGASAATYGLVTGYVEAVRGTPFYVQMWLVFFLAITIYPSLPDWIQSGTAFLFGALQYPPVPEQFYFAGFLALYLNTAGYQAEVLRGGFQSVGQGQVEAAKAIGMRGRSIFRHITLPQALRLVTLPLTNEWISLFKASAILSAIAVIELLFQSQQLGVNEGHPIEAFIMIAAMYLLINVTLGRTITYVERKRRIPGLGTPAGHAEPARRGARRRAPSA